MSPVVQPYGAPLVLLDTGVLVAALDRRDAHHAWAAAQLERFAAPLVTCEGVLAEACYHLASVGLRADGPVSALRQGVARLEALTAADIDLVGDLMARHANVPMDFVDGCLVALASRLPQAQVLTIDRDFFVYRYAEGRAVEAIHPDTHPI